MSREIKILILTILFGFSIDLKASSVRDFDSLSYFQYTSRTKSEILWAYSRFFIKIEALQAAGLMAYNIPLEPESLNAIQRIQNTLSFLQIANARTGSLTGTTCVIGGYISNIRGGFCTHPKNVSDSGYSQGSCSPKQFNCGGIYNNKCVEIATNYEGLSRDCSEAGVSNLAPEEFNKIQEVVNSYCSSNRDIVEDACESLADDLNGIKPVSTPPDDISKEVIQNIDALNKGLNAEEDPCKDCVQSGLNSVCPKYHQSNFEDISSKGLVGMMNVVFEGGGLSSAETVCGSGKPEKAFDYSSVRKQLQNQGLLDGFYTNVAGVCRNVNEGFKKENLDISEAYQATHYATSKENISYALDDLLKVQADINLLAPQKISSDCLTLSIDKNQKTCKDMSEIANCDNPDLLSKQVDTSFKAFKDYVDALKSKDQNQVKALEIAYPELMGENIQVQANFYSLGESKQTGGKKRIVPTLTREKFEFVYLKDLSDRQKDVADKIEMMNDSMKCLRGEKLNCSDSRIDKGLREAEILSKAKARKLSGLVGEEANAFQNYYSCTERIKQAREDADEIIGPALISSTLGFGPRILFSAVNVLAKSSAAVRAGAAANAYKVGDIAATTHALSEVQGTLDNCKQLNSRMEALDTPDSFTCEKRRKVKLAMMNTSSCTSDLLITLASVSPAAFSIKELYRSAKLTGSVDPLALPKTKVDGNPKESPSNINTIEEGKLLGTKPNSSKSWSKKEESRLESADKLLGKKLNDKQKQAIIDAHSVGVKKLDKDGNIIEMAKGKDGADAGIGNYTQAQLREKAGILKNAGFTPDEIRKLMEGEVVGVAEFFKRAKPNQQQSRASSNASDPEFNPNGSRSASNDSVKFDNIYQEAATKTRSFTGAEKFVSFEPFGNGRVAAVLDESFDGKLVLHYYNREGKLQTIVVSDPAVINSIRQSETSFNAFSKKGFLDIDTSLDGSKKVFRRAYNSRNFTQSNEGVSFTFSKPDGNGNLVRQRRGVKIIGVKDNGDLEVLILNDSGTSFERMIISDPDVLATGGMSSSNIHVESINALLKNQKEQEAMKAAEEAARRRRAYEQAEREKQAKRAEEERQRRAYEEAQDRQRRQERESSRPGGGSEGGSSSSVLAKQTLKPDSYKIYAEIENAVNSSVRFDKRSEEAKEIIKKIKKLQNTVHPDKNINASKETKDANEELSKQLNNWKDLLGY